MKYSVMMASAPTLYDAVTHVSSSDAVLETFIDWVQSQRGITLYDAQEEALLELYSGNHVVMNTPTGSGKSLVALGLQTKSVACGQRCYYTAPIKALVSEKFFELCQSFGPEQVGMLTGDASINPDAPLLCCTAEILSHVALREGDASNIAAVIMDEFHYYADSDRGAAWQIPLLTLPNTQFLLMSATLGDMQKIIDDLKNRSGRDVAWVRSAQRPVPLEFEYLDSPLQHSIESLAQAQRAPIYLVNFSQREAAEVAQKLTSVNLTTKEEKHAIKSVIGSFRFDTPYGKDLRRLFTMGVGLHHAGLLPKYRRLCERLAQDGLLKVISGTDTLGVGVNVPIRTVLFTKLYKFDGQKTGILSARDFHQIAGRAGRRGFDEQGYVVCQAPEHVIANRIAAQKAAAKKQKKASKTSPPKDYVAYNQDTFLRLQQQAPETMRSSFAVTHSMLTQILERTPRADRPDGGYKRLVHLIAASHETDAAKSKHRKQAATLFRAMRKSALVNITRDAFSFSQKPFVYLNQDLQKQFALHQDLSLYVIESIFWLDQNHSFPKTAEHNAQGLYETELEAQPINTETAEAAPKTDPRKSFAYNVISQVEAVQESPRALLRRQLDKIKDEKVAALKAAGVEYEERMKQLEALENPAPNAEFIYQSFNHFRETQPWVRQSKASNIKPKSITRDLLERFMTFNEYVKHYGLSRMEGLLLRYLNQSYKILIQTVPKSTVTEEVEDLVVQLRSVLERADRSLIAEWEEMQGIVHEATEQTPQSQNEADLATRQKQLRQDVFHFAKALAKADYEEAALLLKQPEGFDPMEFPQRPSGIEGAWSALDLKRGLAGLQETLLVTDHRLRLGQYCRVQNDTHSTFKIEQSLIDEELQAVSSLQLVADVSKPAPWLILKTIDLHT